MSDLLAVDPSVHDSQTGWAYFDAGQLNALGLGIPGLAHPWCLVIEIPRVYPGQTKRVNPNNIVDLAVRAGVIIGDLRPGETVRVFPKQWKGSVPKTVHNKRVLAQLTDDELARFNAWKCPPSLRHNVIDAIGIGLWYLNKTGERRAK